jgi:putative redox protein
MESVLMAVAACSTVDVEGILKKMRQNLHHIEVNVSAKRADAVPAVFTAIHLHYKAYGDVDEDKLQKAVRLSMDKYCSVSLMLKKSVHITYTVEVVKEE